MNSPGIVVATDLGSSPGRLLAVHPGEPNAWLAEAGASTELKAGTAAGSQSVSVPLHDRAAFTPQSVMARLTAAAVPAPDTAALDRALQDPRFQRIESAWRGISFLSDQAKDAATVEILATARGDLLENLRTFIEAPVESGLRPRPTLVLLDFDFGHQPKDLAELRALGEMAAGLQAPMVAAASPSIFGLRHFAHLVAFPDPIGALQGPSHVEWRQFQASAPARWICLTLGRYLQRTPHEVDSISYREKTEEARPESFLWGRGIWMVGAAAARSIGRHGHPLDLSGQGGMFTDMPSRAYPKSANESVALSTEAPLPEMRASELAWAGFTPLAGVLRAGTVLMPMVVTCSRLSPGRLTLEGALAYQLLAARLAGGLEDLLGGGPVSADSAETHFKSALLDCLGPLAGANPQEAVAVEIVPPSAETGPKPLARIKVTPGMRLEGKQPEFVFELPLRMV